jgi:16S rRNA (guanine1516-N2)-methyltransferase
LSEQTQEVQTRVTVSSRRLVCTTPWRETAAQNRLAAQLANWFGCLFVRRDDRSLSQVCLDEGVDTVVVADKWPKVYLLEDVETPIFFHPGMAMMRILRMERGETDRLVTAAHLKPGQTVLDCTLGAGADSLALAYALGPEGHVISCEVEPVLERLFSYAKANGFEPYVELGPIADRIDVIQMHHLDWLRSLPNGFADVVYFDPMFRAEALGRSASMDALRGLTHPDALSLETLREAQRVARQAVVVKERPQSGEFHRLGLVPDKPRAKIAYGVWHKGEAFR